MKLIEASLHSPVVRNRNTALKALSQWGRDAWPSGIEETLKKCLEAEPDDEVRETIGKVLKGQPLGF
jgi:hypothetical protein